jgi:predicted nucleic acid-binding protein
VADLFLDSSVIVDLLRYHDPAVRWKYELGSAVIGICPVAWMEIIDGAQDRGAQRRAMTMMTQFELVSLEQIDFAWAMQQQIAQRLKFGVGVLDCLIAAPAFRLQLPLYTQNLKHFLPLLGALAQKPY